MGGSFWSYSRYKKGFCEEINGEIPEETLEKLVFEILIFLTKINIIPGRFYEVIAWNNIRKNEKKIKTLKSLLRSFEEHHHKNSCEISLDIFLKEFFKKNF